MNQVRRLAMRWARLLSREPRPISSILASLALGIILVGLYLFRTDHPALLAVGVFLITMTIARFERIGFIALLNNEREDEENQDIHDSRD